MKILKSQILYEQDLTTLKKYKFITYISGGVNALIYMDHAMEKGPIRMFPDLLLKHLFNSDGSGIHQTVAQVFNIKHLDIKDTIEDAYKINSPDKALIKNWAFHKRIINSENKDIGTLFLNIIIGISIPFYGDIKIDNENSESILKDIELKHPELDWYVNSPSNQYGAPYIFVQNITTGFKAYPANPWKGDYNEYNKHPFIKFPYERKTKDTPNFTALEKGNIDYRGSEEVSNEEFTKLVLFQAQFN